MESLPRGYGLDKKISVETIAFIRYFELNDAFLDNMEEHAEWEMVYVDRGECYVISDEDLLLLHQGEMYFHQPHEKHMLKIAQGQCPNIFILCFYSGSPAMYYLKKKIITASLSTKQHIAAIIHEASNTFELPFNDPAFSELALKTDGCLWGGDQTIFIRLELMLIELIRKNSSYLNQRVLRSLITKAIIEDEFCFKVILYMENNIYEKIDLDSISKALSASKSFISKHFLEKVGCSVMEYFNMMKMDEAKRMNQQSQQHKGQ